MSYSPNSIACTEQAMSVLFSFHFPVKKKKLQIHSFLTRLNTDSKSLKMRCTPPVNALKLLKTNKTPADEKMNCLSHPILALTCCKIMHQ